MVSRPASIDMKKRVPRVSRDALAFARSELIGRNVTVAESTDPGLVGLAGSVVDETLRTLTIRVGGLGGRRVQVAKAACVFEFQATRPVGFGAETTGPSGSGRSSSAPGPQVLRVDGRAIAFRPTDRTKKVR